MPWNCRRASCRSACSWRSGQEPVRFLHLSPSVPSSLSHNAWSSIWNRASSIEFPVVCDPHKLLVFSVFRSIPPFFQCGSNNAVLCLSHPGSLGAVEGDWQVLVAFGFPLHLPAARYLPPKSHQHFVQPEAALPQNLLGASQRLTRRGTHTFS